MRSGQEVIIGGVDTHKDWHVAAAVDLVGRTLGTRSFPNTATGHHHLLIWLSSLGAVSAVGVEGTGSFGAGVTRHLTASSVRVVEVVRPNRQRRRRLGKSDAVDAVNAALAVLAGEATAIPKSGDGPVEAIRVLRLTKRSAVIARTQAINQIHAALVTAPNAVRAELAGLTIRTIIATASRFRPCPADDPHHASRLALALLARRVGFLTSQIRALEKELATLVTRTAPQLLTKVGVGTDTAAALLVAAGDNPERLKTEASFAALCGAAPVEASSGRTIRHRLNRGGNRDANSALWWIVVTRMRIHDQTRAYVARRLAEGKTKPEIMRCLKRSLAREIHHALTTPPTLDKT
jgi:transposase